MISFKKYGILVSVGLVLFAGSVGAGSISVPGFSFENPTGYSNNNPSYITGWLANSPSFYGAEGNSIAAKFFSPGTSDRLQAGFLNLDSRGTATLTSAASLATISNNTIYTLTVALGNNTSPDADQYGAPGDMFIRLLANGNVIATNNVINSSVPNGTIGDYSLSFATGTSSSLAGQSLTIQLGTSSANRANAFKI